MPRTKQLFADDLAVGFVFRGEATALTPEHFSQFAALTGDKHPIHSDAAFAAKTKFGDGTSSGGERRTPAPVARARIRAT